MNFRFHPHQFTVIDEVGGIVKKQNLEPVFTIPPNIKVQRFIEKRDGAYVFEYIKGTTLDMYYRTNVPSIILSLLFDLMQKTFVFHDNQWFSWLDDYNQSNFILSESGELVVIDWIEAQWYKVTPKWCINQMKKFCGVNQSYHSNLFDRFLIEQQLCFFIEDNFKDLLPYFDDSTEPYEFLIPMRSSWLCADLSSFRHPAFIECQQYRILNNLENDTTIALGPFDTVEIQDQLWYNFIRQHIIQEETR